MAETADIIVGIDLGTTNTCAAWYHKGQIKSLENKEGSRLTSSVVLFTDKNQALIGKLAILQGQNKPSHCISEIKRLIGKKFDDPHVKEDLLYFSYEVEEEKNDPVIVLKCKNETVKRSPVDISALILKKVKSDINEKLGASVHQAVITVPAYFNINQRQATLAAAKIAGFTVVKLLNEPTAAALSYYSQDRCEEEHYSLVYDLGGGTFDVAVLKREANNIEIIAVDGDSHLGGKDFDNRIINYVCENLHSQYDVDLKSDKRIMRRLRNVCEEAKEMLSVIEETEMYLEGYIDNHPQISLTLSREQFENMVNDLLTKTIEIVDSCLKGCDIPKSKIKYVLLAGGSTRIPKVQQLLSEYFEGNRLNKFNHPDECVAEGAAIQAALLSTNPDQNIDTIKITDVLPLSLGVRDFVDRMRFIIRRNSPIPISESYTFDTVYNNQNAMKIRIYEGERLNVNKNRYLDEITITNLTPAPPGQCKVTITLTVDPNGILKVKAKETHSNNVKDLQIDYTQGNRSDSEVKNAVRDAQENNEEDELFGIFASYKKYVLEYCLTVNYNLENKCLVRKFKSIYDQCKDIQMEALDIVDVEELDKIKELIKDVRNLCSQIVDQYEFESMPDLPDEDIISEHDYYSLK